MNSHLSLVFVHCMSEEFPHPPPSRRVWSGVKKEAFNERGSDYWCGPE